ncbi:MAG TPA: MATE family efflux transporter [Longimicrobium sp.]|nr:MATE family efflux transporter [Longimicrobium sp.]
MARMNFSGARLRAGAAGRAPLPGRRRRARLFAHEVRELLRLAGPIIASQLGGVALNIADIIMVAPLGADALAAAGAATSVHLFALMFCTGTVMGMGPLVSQAYGAGDRPETRRVLVQGLWVAALFSIPVGAISAAGGSFADLLGQPPGVGEVAGDYLVVLAPGVVATMLFVAFRQYLDGMGITRVAMVLNFVGLAVNVVGNWILIWGVEGVVRPMGVVGSGIATSLVRWAMLVGMVAYVAAKADLSPFGRTSLRPVWARMRRIIAIGVPVGASLGAEIGCFATAALMMGWLGSVEMAAHQIAINIASTTFMVALGTSLAGSIRVGQHIGAGRERAVHRAVGATYLVSLLFMGLCALLFLAAPRELIGIYTTDAQIVGVGTSLLFVAALFQIFDGAQVAGLCVLRGAADTRMPMMITILGYWLIGIPVAYLLGFHTPMRETGIWAGLVVSLALVGALLFWRVRRVLWAGRIAPVVQPGPTAVALAAE